MLLLPLDLADLEAYGWTFCGQKARRQTASAARFDNPYDVVDNMNKVSRPLHTLQPPQGLRYEPPLVEAELSLK